jgi:hypothetical protein
MTVFRGIDLPESHIRSWAHADATVWFEIFFILSIDHPFYRQPTLGESPSHKAGKLVFASATKVEGLLPMRMAQPSVTPMGHYDFGTIETMVETAPGVYELSGEFGSVTIRSAEPTIVYGNIGT